jgi:uroporphyrinogen decarboxylase
MMTSKEVVIKTIKFQNPDRFAFDLPEPYPNDFAWVGMKPSPDERPPNGPDEWGSIWENIGISDLGEVKKPVLMDWNDLKKLKIPDIKDPKRWKVLDRAREKAGDKFLVSFGLSLYERPHFIRGMQNLWTDIYTNPSELEQLLDIQVEMNLYAIERFAKAGADGYFFCDDWGLQNSLMISPDAWRQFWKPRYQKVYSAAHKAGLLTFLHSCGYIVDILDDLIEEGLDVIQMDQQENMGLELLGKRFGGRITFFNPVDIQNTMARGNPVEIKNYCHEMAKHLAKHNGGFIPKWYPDPKGAGHSQEAIKAMCEEFLKISSSINH